MCLIWVGFHFGSPEARSSVFRQAAASFAFFFPVDPRGAPCPLWTETGLPWRILSVGPRGAKTPAPASKKPPARSKRRGRVALREGSSLRANNRESLATGAPVRLFPFSGAGRGVKESRWPGTVRQGSGSPMAPLLLTLAAAALAWPCPAAPSESRFSEARVARWAAAALKHVAATQCPDRGGLLPRSQCQRLVRLSQGPGPAVYISEPARPGQKVRALLPDGWGDKPSAPLVPSRNQSGGGGPQRAALPPAGQDAVLVLDPNPGANFGHPLLLFYVDFNVSPRRCRSRDRLYLGE